jgi:ankyrin repeat protein
VGNIRVLIDHPSIATNIRDVKGRTALALAAEIGHKTSLKMLLAKDPDIVNCSSNYGSTPLSLAAKRGHEAIVTILLQAHANPNSLDHDGHTPLSWALRNDHRGIVRNLLSCGAKPTSLAEEAWVYQNFLGPAAHSITGALDEGYHLDLLFM